MSIQRAAFLNRFASHSIGPLRSCFCVNLLAVAIGCGPPALNMPPIGRVSRSCDCGIGIELSASVAPTVRFGDVIELQIRISNPTTEASYYNPFRFTRPESDFAIWLLQDGHQVELTKYGRSVQVRYEVMSWGTSAVPLPLKPRDSKIMTVRLNQLFELEKAGHYDVVVELVPVTMGTSVDERLQHSFKANFDLVP
jgi:hypothetical protein